jgi:hypothetical protein
MEARVGIEPAYTELQPEQKTLPLNVMARIFRIFRRIATFYFNNLQKGKHCIFGNSLTAGSGRDIH